MAGSHTGENIRIEHWVVAQRQGQTPARDMLGKREPFAARPFFWSQHYDTLIAYVGHAASWNHIPVEGDVRKRDCLIRYERDTASSRSPASSAISTVWRPSSK